MNGIIISNNNTNYDKELFSERIDCRSVHTYE